MIKKFIIANWKLEKTFHESMNWIKKNMLELSRGLQESKFKLLICPSTIVLDGMAKVINKFNSSNPEFSKNSILLGAQNCSVHIRGPYTGETSVLSLKDILCNYCLIGHSERRRIFDESDSIIAKKFLLLIKYGITPILCIGESEDDFAQNKIVQKLKMQLEKILEIIKKNPIKTDIFIVYEPWWAVGTESFPSVEKLEQIFIWLNEHINNILEDKKVNIKLLYGGGVNELNIKIFLDIKYLEGFIIGRASLKMDSLKKMCLF